MIQLPIRDVTPETIPILPSDLPLFFQKIAHHGYLETCDGLMDALFEFTHGLRDVYWHEP